MYIPDSNPLYLFDRLKYAMTKKDVLWLANEFSSKKGDIEELMVVAHTATNSHAFHSAWVLESILLTKVNALDFYLPRVVELLPSIDNPSVRRHFAKITVYGLRRIINREVSRVCEKEFWRTDLEPLVEVCFKWFVEEDSKPAVKVHCMEILYLLSAREKWIADELPHIIRNQMEFGTPGLRAKGRAILKLMV